MCKLSSVLDGDAASDVSTTSKHQLVQSKIRTAFPDAISNYDFVAKVKEHLEVHNFFGNTLVATSLCPEAAQRLEEEFRRVYNHHFGMGGLAGFPFGGVTCFGSMAQEIPAGGNCLVVYGPRVGIDRDGTVGRLDGRACCASAYDAAAHVLKVRSDKDKGSPPVGLALGFQQAFVRDLLVPYASRLDRAATIDNELPYVVFDAIEKMMKQTITLGAEEVQAGAKIALLGGIQINTPDFMPDYFLPLTFQVRNNKDQLIEDLCVF